MYVLKKVRVGTEKRSTEQSILLFDCIFGLFNGKYCSAKSSLSVRLEKFGFIN